MPSLLLESTNSIFFHFFIISLVPLTAGFAYGCKNLLMILLGITTITLAYQVCEFLGICSIAITIKYLHVVIPYMYLIMDGEQVPLEVKFIYYETHSINTSEVTQVIDLTHVGIKLYVPSNTVKQRTTTTVGVANTGSFVFPENMVLVSAIYYVTTSVPVTAEIEHCVAPDDKRQSSKLTFAVADRGQMPPYNYKKISNGYFAPEKSSGQIELTNSSFWSIFWSDSIPPMVYMASVLAYRYKRGMYKVLLLAGHSLAVTTQVRSMPVNVVCISPNYCMCV